MITITHTVASAVGLHARPAGQLARLARGLDCATLSVGERTADMKRVFEMLNLGVRQGDLLTISLTGPTAGEIEQPLKEILEAEL